MGRKPLDGVTVVDVSQWVTGGFATLMLANQGAEVIKIERPNAGDDIRFSGPPFVEGEAPYYWTVNYDKKSLELDLKSEEGNAIARELIAEADVFVENFRPGKIEQLGLGYDNLRGENEDLIYCSISAFGQTGPLSNRAGLDLLIQGMSGVMSVTGEEDGEPVKVGFAVTDLITAMWAAFAIVNALNSRIKTGSGEYIDLAMLDSVIPWLTKQAGNAFAGEDTRRMGSRDPLYTPYQAYEAKDGYIILACGNQQTWNQLCEALSRPDLVDDERFTSNPKRNEHADDLEVELERTLREHSVDYWVELLAGEHGLPVGPLHSVEEALKSKQVLSREMITKLEHSTAGEQPVIEHPTNYRNADNGFENHAPVLGEHSRKILKALGYSDGEIQSLIDADVVGETGVESGDTTT
ncbi:CaiB/BaiF CoA transferase family protein [Natronorarus salvus]|uniref:CaiB/BaiF CoA transferase family protein n=1 Tax=Natronorarus salvus TaxID=3117733 RepID=UPI002F268E5F